MEIDIIYDCSETDWKAVSETLKRVGMAYEEPDVHKRAFEASHTTVFVYKDSQLIGLVGQSPTALTRRPFMMLRLFLNSRRWASVG